MDRPSSSAEAVYGVGGEIRPLNENIKQQLCRELGQVSDGDNVEVVDNSLEEQVKSNEREHMQFRGPQELNLEMNRYDPGFIEVGSSGIWKVFHKLRRLTGSKDIILDDIFASLDPHGTGRVSSNAFTAALMGNIGYHATLSRMEIEQIAHFYTDKTTNTVDYRSFMDFVQQPEPKAYDLPHVETDKTKEPRLHSTTADTVELQMLDSILDYVASVLIYKRIHLDGYLRESEAQMKIRQTTTIPHLKKVFINLGIFLDDHDFNMICKWFARNAFQINSTLLLSHVNDAINRVYASGNYDPVKMSASVGKRFVNTSFPKLVLPDMRSCDMREFFQHFESYHGSQNHWMDMSESLDDLVTRLQRTVHSNHIIPRPRFQQFDHLNTGRITIAQFRRGLDECLINTCGKTKVFITPREVQNLIEFYSESYKPGFVMWRAFVNDLEAGKCLKDLHRRPSIDLSDHRPYGLRKEVFDLPCKYARRKVMTTAQHRRTERVLEYVKQQLHDCDLYQFFRAFDKDSRLHVTRNQFREVMRMSNVILREQDAYDLELYFIDYHGFCYMFFLQIFGSIIPPPGAVPEEEETEYRITGVSPTSGLAPYEGEGDTGEEVLRKIKHTVFQRGLRLKYWFESFDKLNSGVMDDETFIRALSAGHNWAFTFSEYKKLIELFRRPLTENIVEYRHFLNTVDEIYTQFDLERSPLINPVPYLGWKERVHNFQSKDWEELGKAINKIVQQGINLHYLSVFKDMDKIKCSTIPHHKYLRAMDTLGVLKFLSEHEQALIFNAFSRPVYHRIEFDYTRFLKACHHVTRPPFTDEPY